LEIRVKTFFSFSGLGVCIFAISPLVFGQHFSMGVVAGTGLTNDYGTRTSYFTNSGPFPTVIGNFQSSGPRGLIAGPTLEFSLPKHIFIEADGLYRELHFSRVDVLSDGTRNSATYPTVTWELPVLAKYKFAIPAAKSLFKPFLEAGPSFRLTGNLNTHPSHYGVTGGVGVELHWWRLNIAPVVRYTRWAEDQQPPYYFGLRSKADQVEFLMGFSDSAGSDLHPFGRHFSVGVVAGASVTNAFATVASPYYANYPPAGAPDGTFLDEGLKSFIVGLTVELELPKDLSVEVDALRWPLRSASSLILSNGTTIDSGSSANPTWVFPVLAKYRLSVPLAQRRLKPFVELGPSFRLVEGHAYQANPGAWAITAGAGVEVKLRAIKVAPSIRYLHWVGVDYPPGYTTNLRPNQAALLVGFTF
jgi:hypothetical protein